MEIVIILLLIGVVSFVVYFQLKGSRPDVVPVQHLGAGKKAVKKAPVQKAAPVTEKWDELEVSKKSKKSQNESPKNKNKKARFDPVEEGKKVLKSETLKKRETAAKAEDEKTEEEKVQEKRTRSRLAADGFVVIDEKKPKAKKGAATEEAAPVEKVAEEAPLSEFEERLAKLREVVAGTRPQKREPQDGEVKVGGYQGKRDIKPEQTEATDDAAEKKPANKDKAIREHLKAIREQNNGAKAGVSQKPGGRIEMSSSTVSAPSAGKRGWEKVQPKKEAAPAPVEEAEETPAAEEAPAAEAADEWAEPVETQEF